MNAYYVIYKNGDGPATIITVYGVTLASVKEAFPTAYDVLAV